jgi:uncharacterized membrane protein required for colicin V production
METGWASLGALNVVDVVAMAFAAWGAIRGFRRGLSGELARLLGIGVALVAGWRLSLPLGERAEQLTRLSVHGSRVAGFVVAFAGAWLAAVALRWILRNLMEFTFKDPLEHVGGAVAGLLRFGGIASALVLAGGLCPVGAVRESFTEGSVLGAALHRHVLPAYTALKEGRPELDLPDLPATATDAAASPGEEGEAPVKEREPKTDEDPPPGGSNP